MQAFFDNRYEVHPTRLSKYGEFIFTENTKMDIIETPKKNIFEMYPFDLTYADYPPYWVSSLKDLRPKKDNVGK